MPHPAGPGIGRSGRSPRSGPRGHPRVEGPVDTDVAILLTSELMTNAIDWSGDPSPVLDHLTVFGPSAADIIE